jgi:hypothetical protein
MYLHRAEGMEQGGLEEHMHSKRKLVMAPMAAAVPFIALAATVFACTNYVGQLWVWGSNTGYDTTGTKAAQVIGNQPFNDPSQAMTQSVNSTVAKTNHGSDTSNPCTTSNARGCFKVYTAPRSDNGWALGSGTYDVNVINIGYSNHTTRSNPNGDCMSWRLPSAVIKVGTVTVGTAGKITSATDNAIPPNSVNVTSNIAGEFFMPSSYVASASPQEAGVCVSSSDSVNGNQAPLTLL